MCTKHAPSVGYLLVRTNQRAAHYAVIRGERRPKIENLYDVFVNVRNDEAEHMKTMEFCQRPGNCLRSPSSREAKVLLSAEACALEDKACEENLDASMGERSCEGLVDCVINFGTGAVETQDMKP